MGAAQGKVTRDDSPSTQYQSERKQALMRGGEGSFVPYVASEHGWNAGNPQTRYEVNGIRVDYSKQYGPAAASSRPAVDPIPNGFDFNSAQPLPWHKPQSKGEESLQFRKLAPLRDAELLKYLDSRNISVGFLVEIDQFLHAHPEITSCPQGVTLLQTMNASSPLGAYKHFIRGYTLPARYKEGIVSTNLSLPVGFRPPSVRERRDPELDDFFDGFEYRWDILEKIDGAVADACHALSTGQFVNASMRRLICYAVWGNPIDAYKWYEYNIQQEYLMHLYLPEHVVLNQIPKPANYTKPTPMSSDVPLRHGHVRARMARANDEGVDVLDVLLSEYKLVLVRKGCRRREIDSLCNRAKASLDNERRSPRGLDVVDMLMDNALGRYSMRRPMGPRVTFSRNHASTRRSARNYTRRLPTGPRVANFLTVQVADLRAVKRNLERLYAMEGEAMASSTRPSQDTASLSSLRGTAERRYVNVLIRYLRDSQQMTAAEASDLQRFFTRQRMDGLGQVNKSYLLGLFPRELA